jgi:hypothetical protein
MARRKQTPPPEEDIQILEAHLAGTLKPVAPSKAVVQRLSTRIRMPNREKVTIYFPDWGRLFLVFGGVISGMLLFITLARALYYLVGRRG